MPTTPKPCKGEIIKLASLFGVHNVALAGCRDAMHCVSTILSYPAVSLRYTAGYAHFIPARLGKKTIKIKITPIYYESG
ncbi:MAG: hypothetical protein LBT09_09025 [Planctomycetaceae bacterium]|jgi:hypothetical protein|nr:hypothetical protein [Planctomycetaceae bacterium]